MTTNVFVLGLDDFQRGELGTIKDGDLRFHPLLDIETLKEAESYDVAALLDRARRELDGFNGSIDVILTHWDFPTSVLGPILCHERGIPAPTLESVLTCEHKYWSRCAQQQAIPECVPEFRVFDPFDDESVGRLDLPYPFWVKPIKSHSSQLGFWIADRHQLEAALVEIHNGIGRLANAFDTVMGMVDAPDHVAGVSARMCLAEQIIAGAEGAAEGSMSRGRFLVHGVVDLHLDDERRTYNRIDYPSSLPDDVQGRMTAATERFLRHIGFDNGCFNAEFMWDESDDRLWVIEFNTRISQSHSDLFAKVDGVTNHKVAIDVACDRTPGLPHRQGHFSAAAKIYLTHDEDAIVTAVPTDEQIARLQQLYPQTHVRLKVATGDRLSDLKDQSVYNYRLAEIYLGAHDRVALAAGQRACQAILTFAFRPVEHDGEHAGP